MPPERIITYKEFGPHDYLQTYVVEPVLGCKLQCRKCLLAPPKPTASDPEKFISPQWLDEQLAELAQGIHKTNGYLSQAYRLPSRPTVEFTGRGNPLEHPQFERIVEICRKHFPNMDAAVLWNLHGLNSQDELVSKTRNLNYLTLSLDGQHYQGIVNQLREEGKPTDAKSVRAHLVQRVRWALVAAKRNDLKLGVQVTGGPAETVFVAKLVKEACGNDYGSLKVKVLQVRNFRPKGFLLTIPTDTAVFRATNSVGHSYPEQLPEK